MSGGNSNKGQRNNGQKNGGGGSNGQGGGGQKGDQNRGRRRKGSRAKKVDPRVFWGDPEQLAGLDSAKAVITSRPSAVVQSLGRPPLSGQQNAAEHYFAAVYDRAVNLAAALAAAGNLIEAEDLNSGDYN
ncbi:MAG: hypothetical protein ACRBK7_07530 [Acidimicrobiales bacterium]